MTKKPVATHTETTVEDSFVLKWGKIVTRVTAISATITGALAAIFSSSSVAGGVALTAAGASTLAAAEKLPDPGYMKTKHVSPLGNVNTKRELGNDVLKPEIPRLSTPKMPRLEPGFKPIPPRIVGRRGESSSES